MQIKELAGRAGVTVKAVRYYESRGLLTPNGNGYREYDVTDVQLELRGARSKAGLDRELDRVLGSPQPVAGASAGGTE